MTEFSFQIDLDGLQKLIDDMANIYSVYQGAYYFASINAAEKARDRVSEQMPEIFDRPTPFIMRGLRITSGIGERVGRRAKNKDIKLGFKDVFGSLQHDPIVDTIFPHVEGGGRAPKPAELRLRRAGILKNNEFLVQAKNAPTNRYGNISSGEYVRMLSDLRTFNEAGFTANRKRGKGRLLRGKGQYFVSEVGGRKGRYRGIFKSLAKGRKIRLTWIIVQRRPNYSKRFPFYELAGEEYARSYPAELNKTLLRQFKRRF